MNKKITMTDELKNCILFKADTGELILPMKNSTLFVTMNIKDLQMAEKYIDLLIECKANNTIYSLPANKEYKRVNKYFYDKGRYIKNKHTGSLVQSI